MNDLSQSEKNGGNQNQKKTKKVTFRIFRFDPSVDEKPYYQDFVIEAEPGLTVLYALFRIMEEQDPSLALRYACRAGICGSDGMIINGKFRLSCQTQVHELGTDVITISPLPGYPIIKDLVVDMSHFFEKLYAVDPFLQPDEEHLPEKEFIQLPKDFEKIEEPGRCILCGCCTAACPVSWTNPDYLGPAALLKAYRFVDDSRDIKRSERLKKLNHENSVWRCHTVFNCVEACPKELHPTEAIQKLKRSIFVNKVKGLFKRS